MVFGPNVYRSLGLVLSSMALGLKGQTLVAFKLDLIFFLDNNGTSALSTQLISVALFSFL
jgi:hypothetical protein